MRLHSHPPLYVLERVEELTYREEAALLWSLASAPLRLLFVGDEEQWVCPQTLDETVACIERDFLYVGYLMPEGQDDPEQAVLTIEKVEPPEGQNLLFTERDGFFQTQVLPVWQADARIGFPERWAQRWQVQTEQVSPALLVDLQTVLPERKIRICTAGPKQELIVVTQEGWIDMHRIRFCIHRMEAGAVQASVEIISPRDLHFVQPLPNGEWLVVGQIGQGDMAENAMVFSSEGELLRTFATGGMLSDVQVTADGAVWLSYWTKGGARRLDGPQFFEEERCYALNVTETGAVWLYPGGGFPLVQVQGDVIAQRWSDTPANGYDAPTAYSQAFAVWDDRALFAVGKQEVYLVDLSSKRVQRLRTNMEFELSFARGSRLYLLTEDDVLYVLDLQGK